MAIRIPRYIPPDPAKQDLLDTFSASPESQAWALNWDGHALHAHTNTPVPPPSSAPKPKQEARS